jgi:copper chaperone
MTQSQDQGAIINVAGMNCQHCVQTVTNALAATAGVKHVQVELEKKQASVRFDAGATTIAKLMQAVNLSGFKATGFTRTPGE